MPVTAAGAPHVAPDNTVQKVMAQVLIALLPGMLAYLYYFGVGLLVQLLLALSFAYLFEWLSLLLRKQPLRMFMTDLSAAVTAVLFALSLPPLAPWWCSLIGMLFAIVIAKHLFGGLGYNRFNPAMVGLAVLLISFPRIFTYWTPPVMLVDNTLTMRDVLLTIFAGQPPAALSWDAITQATPLDQLSTGAATGLLVTEVRQNPVFGDFGGLGWEWIANWYAVGGLWLLWRRVINWRVPVAVLLTTFLLTTPFYLFDPDANPLPLQHIFSGATVLAAFFIATDPVSGSATPRGQLLFGIGVAVIMLSIRRWGAYPDGVAFAILVMNMFAPLLDQYTRPRVFGHAR